MEYADVVVWFDVSPTSSFFDFVFVDEHLLAGIPDLMQIESSIDHCLSLLASFIVMSFFVCRKTWRARNVSRRKQIKALTITVNFNF
jgi:hypothetical protein